MSIPHKQLRIAATRVASRHIRKSFTTPSIRTEEEGLATIRNILQWIMEDYGKQLHKILEESFDTYFSESLNKEFSSFLKVYVKKETRFRVPFTGTDIRFTGNIPVMFQEFLGKDYGPEVYRDRYSKIFSKNSKQIAMNLWEQVRNAVVSQRSAIEKNFSDSETHLDEQDRRRQLRLEEAIRKDEEKQRRRDEKERQLEQIQNDYPVNFGMGFSHARVGSWWKKLIMRVTSKSRPLTEANFREVLASAVKTAEAQLNHQMSTLSAQNVDLLLKAMKRVQSSEIDKLARVFLFPYISQVIPNELKVRGVDRTALDQMIDKRKLL